MVVATCPINETRAKSLMCGSGGGRPARFAEAELDRHTPTFETEQEFHPWSHRSHPGRWWTPVPARAPRIRDLFRRCFSVAAQDMIARFAEWQGREPGSVAADATYGNGEFLQWLMEQDITPYMRTRHSALRKNSPLYGSERSIYHPESNSYLCPEGQQLNYGGHNARNRTHVYIGTRKRCGGCAQKPQYTSSPLKYLAIYVHEPARQRARDLVNTAAFVDAQRQRKRSEGFVCGTQESDRTAPPAFTQSLYCCDIRIYRQLVDD
jgi:hypothetical protein